MSKYRKILVAYDGSDSSRTALAVAADLAKKDKCWIKVLAVVPPYYGDLELIGVSKIKETIEGPGQDILAEAKQLAKDHDVHILTNLEQGEPYDRIVHVADDENCDLIVIGRRGRRHLERELMGGVTARVIGYTKRNVLVVPEGANLSWENILVATDESENSRHAFDLALDIAKERSAQLSAMSVIYTNDELSAFAPDHVTEMVQSKRSFHADLKTKAAGKDVKLSTYVREGEPHEQITDLANEIKASVIVMGTHGRKGLHRILMGSVTERTIGYSSCPIMIVH
ncbi:MAG: universal stress protein [Desulfobulbaceae bacterium]|nr:universal stress protein [Desulfobulbaceae bacterium]